MGLTVAELEQEVVSQGAAQTGLLAEVADARGTAGTLGARLDVALNPDGTLRSSAATVSFVTEMAPIISYPPTGAYVALDGDLTDVYVAKRRLRINGALLPYVISSTYDAGGDYTVVNFSTPVGNSITSVEYSFDPAAMPPIHYSGNPDIEQVESSISTLATKHLSDAQYKSLLDDILARVTITSLASVDDGAGVDLVGRAFKYVDTIDDLRTLTPTDAPVYVQGRTVPGDGGRGIFVWSTADLSAEVTADTLQGIYVAPTSDPTGASGAWVRQLDGYVTPEMFGAIPGVDSYASFQAAADSGKTVVINATDAGWVVSSYIEVTTDGQKFICHGEAGNIRQSTYGKPVFYVLADDVSIINPNLISSETRTLISGTMATNFVGETAAAEGTLAAFEFSAGIFVSGQRTDKGHRFKCVDWYVHGFGTNGIFIRGGVTPNTDSNLGHGHGDTLDWAVKCSNFQNMTISYLLGTNIITAGSAQPEHVLYALAGGPGSPGNGLIIGEISARDVSNGRHAFQVKYTHDLSVGTWNAVNCSSTWNTIEVKGVIGPGAAHVDDNQSGSVMSVQDDSDIIAIGHMVEGPYVNQGFAVTVASKLKLVSPVLRHTGGTPLSASYPFYSSSSDMTVIDPEVSFETSTSQYIFYAANSTTSNLDVQNPQVIGAQSAQNLFKMENTSSKCILAFDPKRIDADLGAASIYCAASTGPYNITYIGQTATAIVMQVGTATPIVSSGTLFTLANTSAQNVTDFSRIPIGHRWRIRVTTANTTFVHTAGVLELSGDTNYNPVSGKVIEFTEVDGVVYETWRS